MKTLAVELASHRYPIHIGRNLLGQAELYDPHIGDGGVLIVTNETVGPLYLSTLEAALGDRRIGSVVLPDGEQFKTWETLNRIFDALIDGRFARDVTIVALGGGVVGDMAGFAAAAYQRGVNYIQVPTTLLAQVDSSVGGKTAINHPGGKNMVGAFHQPVCVVIDTDTLNTLGDREMRCGVAETIKYGLIRDPEFFDWMEANAAAILAHDGDALTYAIARACQNKADVVAIDEKEHGDRALLNFGHTFGHAIETGLGHGKWLHGEAVGAGMHLAADLSVRLGLLQQDSLGRISELLRRCHLPLNVPKALDVEQICSLMAVDKKVKADRIRLVLLRDIGEALLTDDFDPDALRTTLSICRDAA
jgi:3-dehydroquinate synthase